MYIYAYAYKIYIRSIECICFLFLNILRHIQYRNAYITFYFELSGMNEIKYNNRYLNC